MSVSPKFYTSQADSIGADWFGPHVSVPQASHHAPLWLWPPLELPQAREAGGKASAERLGLMEGDSDSKFHSSFALIASLILGT